jgi:hypothetical protein
MHEILAVSYTGDLLAHRRCPRAWAYGKQAGFHPYEQAQALEGRLVHHTMEWLVDHYRANGLHADAKAVHDQLVARFSILWSRGLKTAFASKAETVDRVLKNIYPDRRIHPTVREAVEGASHTEYELRAVRKILPGDFSGKEKLMLTGILDLVVHQRDGFTISQTWIWTSIESLQGQVSEIPCVAQQGDLEVWDYKGTRADGPYERDYVLQLLTYARLYQERTGELPKRCVLFYINEPSRTNQLLAIPITEALIDSAEAWTIRQAQLLRGTALQFQRDPASVEGGSLEYRDLGTGSRIDEVLKQQCTACGHRFNCRAYSAYLGDPAHPDIDIRNVSKN